MARGAAAVVHRLLEFGDGLFGGGDGVGLHHGGLLLPGPVCRVRRLPPVLLLDHRLHHPHLRAYIVHTDIGALLLRVNSDGLFVRGFLFRDEALLL